MFDRLLAFNGEGSFSSILFDCNNNNATTINSECVPVRVRLTPYNNVIATQGMSTHTSTYLLSYLLTHYAPGMSLLPPSVYTGSGLPPRDEIESKLYNQTLCNGKFSRVLIAGLGGGEMHQFLLKHHPCLYVDSIELNKDVMITAQQYLGFLLLLHSLTHLHYYLPTYLLIQVKQSNL